jgi:hypothetical protein
LVIVSKALWRTTGPTERVRALAQTAWRAMIQSDILIYSSLADTLELLLEEMIENHVDNLEQLVGKPTDGQNLEWLLAIVAALSRVGRFVDAHPYLIEALKTGAQYGRYRFLTALAISAPVLARLDEGVTLWQIFTAVEEIDGWWSSW